MVRVRVFEASGKLAEAVDVPKLVLSEEQWKARLTPAQFRILRASGTEAAFCGGLLHNKEEGVYACVGCGLPLFETGAKFDSGTGWPSFYRPIAKENIAELVDNSHGMRRVEIRCARCDGHLGHVFDDGPKPTGLRYCLNSEAMRFVPRDKIDSLAERAEAVFAGGCFWCVEAVFEQIDGVYDAVSGYAGGDKATANYEAVSTGTTRHAEVVKIIYDPRKVKFDQLLKVHFDTHDPTTLNRQGNDAGPQYRSAIFYADETQKQAAKAYIDKLTKEKAFSGAIATTLEPLEAFYPAEGYHQNYADRNPSQPYIRAVAQPKVDKVREKFKPMLKPEADGKQ